MTIAAAKGYDINIVETKVDKSKHSIVKFNTYALHKKDYILHIGNYTNLLNLHKKLKDLLQFNFIKNDKKDIFSLSYNTRYFYIKNTKTNSIIGIQKEYVHQLSVDIGKFIFNKMTENKKLIKKN